MLIPPERMISDERLKEIADILAIAIIRRKKRKPRKTKQFQLDSSREESVYGYTTKGEIP